MSDPFEEYDEDYDPCLDPDYCDRCQGEGRIPTADFESYFGADYKPCPVCHGNLCEDQPPCS